MEEIIPDRIKIARRLCRFSMDELARRMGEHAVSKMAISKFERGLLRPSQATLQAIAAACGRPVSFFCKPLLNLGSHEFRFKSHVSPRQQEQIRIMAEEQLRRYFELQTLEGDVTPFVHPMRGKVLRNYADAEAAALRLRRLWEIGQQPIHSVYELLACYGFHVLELDFGCDNVDGLSTFVNDTVPVVIINTRANSTTERRRFTALHEVCHLLFRLCPDDDVRHQAYLATLPPLPYEVTFKQPTEERLCDFFASAMLMPESCVLRRFGTVRRAVSLKELIITRELYGISVAAQVHRLHDLRVIDDDLYHYFYEGPIRKNKLEEGWGTYPIMEKADHHALLDERLRFETINGRSY